MAAQIRIAVSAGRGLQRTHRLTPRLRPDTQFDESIQALGVRVLKSAESCHGRSLTTYGSTRSPRVSARAALRGGLRTNLSAGRHALCLPMNPVARNAARVSSVRSKSPSTRSRTRFVRTARARRSSRSDAAARQSLRKISRLLASAIRKATHLHTSLRSTRPSSRGAATTFRGEARRPRRLRSGRYGAARGSRGCHPQGERFPQGCRSPTPTRLAPERINRV